MNEESTTQMLLLLLFTALAVFDGDGTVAQVTPSIYISPFIAGGEETDIRIYPFTVSIQYKMRHRCGGVIINKNVVLTAAHCIDDDMTADTNGWEVVAGRSNLLNNEEGQRLKVQSTKIHPNYTYNKTVLLNDIGLIWLKRRFVWSDSVQPANLSQTWNIDLRPFVSYFDSFVVTTIGWGRLQDNGAYPGLLHHVNQTINIGDDCLNTLQSEEARSSYGSIMFCTNDKGKEACEGDSGGPVVYNDEVIGIVSHGYGEEKGCEHVVGWKIKVATYYSWIDEELKQGPSAEKKRIFCYYGSWSTYRNNLGKLDIENIDPFLCTDIIYAFAGLDSNNRIKQLHDSGGKGGFRDFTSLKESNPQLKTWISIGGWEEGSLKYSKMVSETTSRAVFIESVVAILQIYGFDGVDIHWLHPGMRGGSVTDRFFLVFLLKELRESLDKHGFLLSVAAGVKKDQITLGYDIPEISRSVHYIILLTHTYHGDWEKFTGLNAPLYPQETDISEVDLYNNVNWTVNHWIANKAEREKLILGIAAFGRGWILEDPMDPSVGARATGGTDPTEISNQYGFFSYSEICVNILNGWQEVNDNFTKSPYAFFENQWVGYDNPWSVGIKSKFINELELGGAAIWSLENDDFLNLCGGGKSPLTNTVKQILGAVFEGDYLIIRKEKQFSQMKAKAHN